MIRPFRTVRRLLPILILLILASAQGLGSGKQAALPALFPKSNEVAGWALKEGPKLFSGSRLFDYMDGAAEIPRSYDFQQLGSAKYANGKTVLEVAIFDMGRSENAFGYYSARSFLEHNPRSKERILPLDHPAHLYTAVGILTFWKGRYTVIVQPEIGKPDEPTLLQFARRISAKVREKGSPPNLLRRLPSVGMIASSARYIRGKAAFDTLLLFAPNDLFGAANGADAVAAEYPLAGGAVTLCVVRCPNASAAAGASNALRLYLTSRKAVFSTPRLRNAFVGTAPRLKGTGAVLSGRYLGVVTGAKDAKTTESALGSLQRAMANPHS